MSGSGRQSEQYLLGSGPRRCPERLRRAWAASHPGMAPQGLLRLSALLLRLLLQWLHGAKGRRRLPSGS